MHCSAGPVLGRRAGDCQRCRDIAERVKTRVQADRRHAGHGAHLLRSDPDRTRTRRVRVGISRRRQRDAHVRTRSGGTPRSTFCIATKVRTSRLDPASSISESATSATTSRLAEQRLASRLRRALRPDFAHRCGDVAALPCNAGARPQSDARHDREHEREDQDRRVQRDFGFVRNRVRRHQRRGWRAGRRRRGAAPTAPATSARSRLSVSNWRTSRLRLAPSAARTVISRCRAAPSTAGGSTRSRTRSRAAARPHRTAPRCRGVMPLGNVSLNDSRPTRHLSGKLIRLARLQVRDDRRRDRPQPARR